MKIVTQEFARARGIHHVKLSGGRAAITDSSLDGVIEQSQPVGKPSGGPTIQAMLGNFLSSTARWAKAGLTLVDENGFASRLGKCRKCPKNYWNETARMGLGKCSAPGCGCTKIKLWLSTERCPLGQW